MKQMCTCDIGSCGVGYVNVIISCSCKNLEVFNPAYQVCAVHSLKNQSTQSGHTIAQEIIDM